MMKPYTLAVAISLHTGKIIKKPPHVLRESLLQNGILHIVFSLSQFYRNGVGKLEFTQMKIDFSERGSAL